jgi:prepilin-type N-terminal cleavage/methylation domain-containing protein
MMKAADTKGRKASDARGTMLGARAFTLIELLVAMAVLALLVVLLMGIVESASKLWRDSESRVDSYREARAAVSIMSRDLRNSLSGTNVNNIRIDNDAFALLSDAEKNTNSAGAIFFLSAQARNAQQSGSNKSDICQIGYFLAYGKTSMVPGPGAEASMNLYRYFLSSDATFSRLTNSPAAPFTNGITPTDSSVELLARNVKSLRIQALNEKGAPYTPTANAPLPPIVEINITALNRNIAAKLKNKADWTNAQGPIADEIMRNQQDFSTRVRLVNTP